MAAQMRRVPVRMPSLAIQGVNTLYTAVVGPTGEDLAGVALDAPVLLLLHSFDSSSLEWRRLYPLIAESAGMPVVAVDLVGWGFTDHQAWWRNPKLPLGAAQKREHLEAFRQQHLGGRPLVIAGTSLGGTIAADYALENQEVVRQLVLLDAQGFSNGVAPLPRPLAWLGVEVLRTKWLREQASQQAYVDKPKFATPDAMRAGRLHTFLPGWRAANVAFISSGGYSLPEARIKQMKQDVLLLWGAQDEILPPPLADKWEAALTARPQGTGSFTRVMIERAGHSPQLEQPDAVAKIMLGWLAQRRGGQPAASQAAAAAAAVPQVAQ